MFASRPRGSRIVYVAASARELPDEVQQWLGRAEHRAASSPHVYDALALLAGGARPAVMIVSIEAVDWSEMEFFDQATRLSRATQIFVTGHAHQAAKVEAACRRGASRFDAEIASESLAGAAAWGREAGVNSILAASLHPPASSKASATPPIRPVPPEPETEGAWEHQFATADGDWSTGQEESEQPNTESQPGAHSLQPPPVRLIDTAGPEPAASAEEEPTGPIPFPWAPSANRPQRTPPRPRPANADPQAGPAAPARASAPAQGPRHPVELTSDELAALMGRPIGSEKQATEGTG